MRTNLIKLKKHNYFYKKFFLNAIKEKSILKIREISKKIEEKDIALFLNELTNDQKFFVIRSLHSIQAAEVFNFLDDDVVEKLVKSLTNEETKKIISFLYSDDIVELIEDLPPKLVEKILKSCSHEQRKNINIILNYPESTVGSEMNVEFIKIKETWKISDVINVINEKIKNKIFEEQQNFYVVDDYDKLIGYVSSMDLIAYKEQQKDLYIKKLIQTNVISINALDNKEKLVELVQKYEVSQLPVVDMNNRLVGIINTEQSLQIMEDVDIEDINKQIGITKSGFKKYFELNIFEMFTSRIFWLSITFLISTISQIILKAFLTKSIPELTKNKEFIQIILPYLPFILTIVGNVALQSTAMIVKNITLNEVKEGNFFKTFIKEFKISMLILISIIILNIPRVIFIDWIFEGNVLFSEKISTLIYWKNLGIATLIIIFSLSFSVFLSSGLPILATKFKKDPSLISSPLLTTLIDLTVTLIALTIGYLLIA